MNRYAIIHFESRMYSDGFIAYVPTYDIYNSLSEALTAFSFNDETAYLIDRLENKTLLSVEPKN